MFTSGCRPWLKNVACLSSLFKWTCNAITCFSNYVRRQNKKPQVTEGSANVTNGVPATGLRNKTLGEWNQYNVWIPLSPQNPFTRTIRLVLVISHSIIHTGLRPSQHMNFSFQTVYKTCFTRNAIHKIKPSIYSEYTSLLSHCFRNVLRSIALKHFP